MRVAQLEDKKGGAGLTQQEEEEFTRLYDMSFDVIALRDDEITDDEIRHLVVNSNLENNNATPTTIPELLDRARALSTAWKGLSAADKAVEAQVAAAVEWTRADRKDTAMMAEYAAMSKMFYSTFQSEATFQASLHLASALAGANMMELLRE